ncbi:MarR family transcriptional regulator [Pelagibius sp. CAU 1746]|uniref:MarR family winged helix-turn-helix transcriptional regulator n=1 Tax=Pelagibius sp. CAU 1746 TaxID=3140370 RepID=UPI00325BE468
MAAKNSNPLELERQFCFAVYSTAHALNRAYKPLLDRLGVTYPQYLVLLALWEEDGRSVGSLGTQLMLDSSTLTPLLKRMEAAGLLRRERSREDERQVTIRLAPKGRRLREKAKTVPKAVQAATQCSARELDRLRERVAAVRDAILETVETD